MKKEKFSKIITLNPYADSYYKFQSNELNEFKKLTYDSSNYYISLLYPKDFITTVVELSINIDSSDVKDAIEIKAYEELGLDQSVEYKIEYFEELSHAEKDNRVFNVFVTEPDTVDELFTEIVERTKFIDEIVPAPLLFRQVYRKEILPNTGVHSFLYFTKKDAFIVYFQDGRYVYSKSIKYSLEYIFEQYCSLIGERIDINDFYQGLEDEGLKSLDNSRQRNFMKLFGEVFMHINDINIYFKRAFDVKKIDNLYVGSMIGNIVGIEEYAKTYLGISPDELDFNFDINTESWYIDQLHYLMVLHSLDRFKGDEDFVSCNFTNFFRPPPFYMRKSGQAIISVAAAVVLAAAYPVYNMTMSTYFDISYSQKRQTQLALQKEVNTIKGKIAQKTKEKNEWQKRKDEAQLRYDSKLGSLETISAKKQTYIPKSNTIHQLTRDLNKIKVYVSNIKSDHDIYTLTLKSKSDKKITEFIKYITLKRESISDITIEKIELDEKSSIYTTEVEVHIR